MSLENSVSASCVTVTVGGGAAIANGGLAGAHTVLAELPAVSGWESRDVAAIEHEATTVAPTEKP